jgi:hypothetical protein
MEPDTHKGYHYMLQHVVIPLVGIRLHVAYFAIVKPGIPEMCLIRAAASCRTLCRCPSYTYYVSHLAQALKDAIKHLNRF